MVGYLFRKEEPINQQHKRMIHMHYTKSSMVCIVSIFLSSCSPNIDTNMSEPMVDFEFTTQDNETLTLEHLKGDWWISNFAYTNCRTICPRTTSNMANIQSKLKEADI